MLKLRLFYFGHIMRRNESLEKTIILGGNEGRRKRGRPNKRWIDSIREDMDMKLQELNRLVNNRCESL